MFIEIIVEEYLIENIFIKEIKEMFPVFFEMVRSNVEINGGEIFE